MYTKPEVILAKETATKELIKSCLIKIGCKTCPCCDPQEQP